MGKLFDDIQKHAILLSKDFFFCDLRTDIYDPVLLRPTVPQLHYPRKILALSRKEQMFYNQG